MVGDRPRTEAYRAAILASRHLFKDKVVLDIGAGTGQSSVLTHPHRRRHQQEPNAESLLHVTMSDDTVSCIWMVHLQTFVIQYIKWKLPLSGPL